MMALHQRLAQDLVAVVPRKALGPLVPLVDVVVRVDPDDRA